MKTTFEKSLEFVLSFEGGYSNDPKDSGGETNFGISRRSYPGENIQGMTLERATHIYQRDFWDFCKCSLLPAPLALAVFDCAVNQGNATAAYLLQEVLHVHADGIIGTVTIQAALRCDIKKTLEWFIALRCDRYSKAKDVHIFGKGWFHRAAACLLTALEPQ